LFVKSAAEKNGIAGDVTTLSDGTVQILVNGTERRVDAFKSELTTVSNAAPDQIEEVTMVRDNFPLDFAMAVARPDLVSILLYLLGPDPLEMLCRGVIRVPDSVT
jgi:acylphosphatase